MPKNPRTSNVTYDLKNLSPQQANTIIIALDTLYRIGSGQFDKIIDLHRDYHHKNFDNFQVKSQLCQEALKIAAFALTGTDTNLSIGSSKLPDIYKRAYEIECVIRKQMALAEGHDQSSVWHREPLSYTGEKPPEGSFNVRTDLPAEREIEGEQRENPDGE